MAGIVMDQLLHDVLQVELQLLQPVLLYFFLLCKESFSFKLFHQMFVLLVLVGKLPEFLIGLHQMRFDVCFL